MAQDSNPAPPVRKAAQERLQEGEHCRRWWCYTAAAGTQLEEVLEPRYWAWLRPQPQPWDLIELREELGAYWALLLVRSSSPDGVVVAGVLARELDGMAPRNFQPFDAAGCTITYRGPFLCWCVEAPDGRRLKGGFADEKQAAAWLASYLRTVRNT